MCTGWTFDEVGEQFDIPRLNAMNKYWQKYPPVHLMIASYLGAGEGKKEKDDEVIVDDGEAFLKAFGAFGGF